MAQFTEQALAESLKRLMAKQKLDDLSVKELIADCGVNRKTFYYHFHGIYELLQWMLTRDLKTAIGEPMLPDTWKRGMVRGLRYVKENRSMWEKVYKSKYWPETRLYLDRLLNEVMRTFTTEALRIYRRETGEAAVLSESDFNYVVRFYSLMIFAALEEWFASGMREEPDLLPEILDKLAHDGMYKVFKNFQQ